MYIDDHGILHVLGIYEGGSSLSGKRLLQDSNGYGCVSIVDQFVIFIMKKIVLNFYLIFRIEMLNWNPFWKRKGGQGRR